MPRAHPHVATTTALARICAAGLACRGWEPRADETRAPEAPIPPDEAPWSLRSPLRAAAPVTGWFDHAAEPWEGCVLAADGTWRRGTSGHRGVDLDVATGTPVVAMQDGRVGLAGLAPRFRCPLDGRWVEDQRTVELVTTGCRGTGKTAPFPPLHAAASRPSARAAPPPDSWQSSSRRVPDPSGDAFSPPDGLARSSRRTSALAPTPWDPPA